MDTNNVAQAILADMAQAIHGQLIEVTKVDLTASMVCDDYECLTGPYHDGTYRLIVHYQNKPQPIVGADQERLAEEAGD